MLNKISKALFALICFSSSALAAPERAGDFALLDAAGEFHQLSRYRHMEALVMMSFDGSCEAMPTALAEFKNLNQNWQDEDVAFAMINAAEVQDAAVAAIRAGS